MTRAARAPSGAPSTDHPARGMAASSSLDSFVIPRAPRVGAGFDNPGQHLFLQDCYSDASPCFGRPMDEAAVNRAGEEVRAHAVACGVGSRGFVFM